MISVPKHVTKCIIIMETLNRTITILCRGARKYYNGKGVLIYKLAVLHLWPKTLKISERKSFFNNAACFRSGTLLQMNSTGIFQGFCPQLYHNFIADTWVFFFIFRKRVFILELVINLAYQNNLLGICCVLLIRIVSASVIPLKDKVCQVKNMLFGHISGCLF